MKRDDTSYRSYLLRIWVEVVDGVEKRRFSLEDPFTGDRKGFANMEDLFTYLEKQIQQNQEE
jgi:hypothetical protein